MDARRWARRPGARLVADRHGYRHAGAVQRQLHADGLYGPGTGDGCSARLWLGCPGFDAATPQQLAREILRPQQHTQSQCEPSPRVAGASSKPVTFFCGSASRGKRPAALSSEPKGWATKRIDLVGVDFLHSQRVVALDERYVLRKVFWQRHSGRSSMAARRRTSPCRSESRKVRNRRNLALHYGIREGRQSIAVAVIPRIRADCRFWVRQTPRTAWARSGVVRIADVRASVTWNRNC